MKDLNYNAVAQAVRSARKHAYTKVCVLVMMSAFVAVILAYETFGASVDVPVWLAAIGFVLGLVGKVSADAQDTHSREQDAHSQALRAVSGGVFTLGIYVLIQHLQHLNLPFVVVAALAIIFSALSLEEGRARGVVALSGIVLFVMGSQLHGFDAAGLIFNTAAALLVGAGCFSRGDMVALFRQKKPS